MMKKVEERSMGRCTDLRLQSESNFSELNLKVESIEERILEKISEQILSMEQRITTRLHESSKVLNHLKNNLTPEIDDEIPSEQPFFIGPPDKYKPHLPNGRRMTRDEFRFMLLNFNNSYKVDSMWIQQLRSCHDVDAFLNSFFSKEFGFKDFCLFSYLYTEDLSIEEGVGLINAAEEIFEKPIREEIRPSLWTTNSFCTTSEWMYLCYHVQAHRVLEMHGESMSTEEKNIVNEFFISHTRLFSASITSFYRRYKRSVTYSTKRAQGKANLTPTVRANLVMRGQELFKRQNRNGHLVQNKRTKDKRPQITSKLELYEKILGKYGFGCCPQEVTLTYNYIRHADGTKEKFSTYIANLKKSKDEANKTGGRNDKEVGENMSDSNDDQDGETVYESNDKEDEEFMSDSNDEEVRENMYESYDKQDREFFTATGGNDEEEEDGISEDNGNGDEKEDNEDNTEDNEDNTEDNMEDKSHGSETQEDQIEDSDNSKIGLKMKKKKRGRRNKTLKTVPSSSESDIDMHSTSQINSEKIIEESENIIKTRRFNPGSGHVRDRRTVILSDSEDNNFSGNRDSPKTRQPARTAQLEAKKKLMVWSRNSGEDSDSNQDGSLSVKENKKPMQNTELGESEESETKEDETSSSEEEIMAKGKIIQKSKTAVPKGINRNITKGKSRVSRGASDAAASEVAKNINEKSYDSEEDPENTNPWTLNAVEKELWEQDWPKESQSLFSNTVFDESYEDVKCRQFLPKTGERGEDKHKKRQEQKSRELQQIFLKYKAEEKSTQKKAEEKSTRKNQTGRKGLARASKTRGLENIATFASLGVMPSCKESNIPVDAYTQ